MMRHSMDIIKQATLQVNPGQTPVLTADQPLDTICKQIQWTWPADYGEDNFSSLYILLKKAYSMYSQ